MRLISLLIASSALAATAPLLGQANAVVGQAQAADLTVGAKVFGKGGEEVGTIAAVADGNVVLAIGEHRATLAATALGKTAAGLSIAMTKAELTAQVEAAAAENAAKLAAALQTGAEVHSRGGSAIVGQVKSLTSEAVEVTTASGTVLVPRTAMILIGAGLAVNLSAEQFAEAVKQATAAAPTGGT